MSDAGRDGGEPIDAGNLDAGELDGGYHCASACAAFTECSPQSTCEPLGRCRFGWCWENPYPQGARLRDVWFDSVTGESFAVGDVGTVLDGDGAQTWGLMAVPTTESLLSVVGRSRADVWAGSSRSLLHFDGRRWQVDAMPAPGVLRQLLTTSDTLWACTSEGVFARQLTSSWNHVGPLDGGQPCATIATVPGVDDAVLRVEPAGNAAMGVSVELISRPGVVRHRYGVVGLLAPEIRLAARSVDQLLIAGPSTRFQQDVPALLQISGDGGVTLLGDLQIDEVRGIALLPKVVVVVGATAGHGAGASAVDFTGELPIPYDQLVNLPELSAVAARTDGGAFAVGRFGAMLVMAEEKIAGLDQHFASVRSISGRYAATDDGVWQHEAREWQPVIGAPDGGRLMRSVAALSGTQAWAIGEGGWLYGITGGAMVAQQKLDLDATALAGAGDQLVVAGAHSTAVRCQVSSSTSATCPLSVDMPGQTLRAAWMAQPDFAVVAGDQGIVGTFDTSLHLHQGVGSTGSYVSVDGEPGSPTPAVWVASESGVARVQAPFASMGSFEPFSLTALSPVHGVAVSSLERVTAVGETGVFQRLDGGAFVRVQLPFGQPVYAVDGRDGGVRIGGAGGAILRAVR